jgi:spore germination protein YaaH
MNTKIYLSILLLLFAFSCFSQNTEFKSIHQEQSEYYKQFGENYDWSLIRGAFKSNGRQTTKACNLNKIVFGWHPYWSNGLEANYDWSLISDLSYFSYEVDPATGNASTTHSWASANVVTQALANGVRVNLCVTLFSSHATFFANSTSQQTLITNLINLVQSRGANGVNIDFEGVPSDQETQLTAFMINLCNQMHTAIPGSQVSIALFSVDWSGVFDIPALNNYVDLFVIMGYDYYYGGSSTAGPNDPLYNFITAYNYTLTKSITYYLSQGVTKSKLILGLPYYGKQWATASNAIGSATTATGTSPFYNTVRNNTSGNYTTKLWDQTSFTPYYTYQAGSQWYQCWIDDAYSLGKRYDMVNQRGIGGIGIWALGYDDGYPELWDKIKAKFTTCRIDNCTDTIYDMGGPVRNYYDKENYSFTISPVGASSVMLNFQSFNLETGYDSLYLYNGTTTNSPLIGGYTGTNIPATITSTGPSLTLKFHSDNLTTTSGYSAIWQCLTDNISPTTLISNPSPWITQNFVANYIDSDNLNGSGVEKSFYNISDFDGTNWSANSNNGFFTDSFYIQQPIWTSALGTWNINTGELVQTNETENNSNFYAPLNQNLSNRYLYHFRAKVEGTDANKRFGFHLFCDDASQTNRGNSYFVWFRLNTSAMEFYKVIGNTFSTASNIVNNVITTTGQYYDFKITYDRILGIISVWRDNIFIGSWTDPTPYSTNGNYISFRSGNSKLTIDNLEVYRSRLNTTNISIGDSSKDIRFQNPNPSTPSAQIKSIIVDANKNLSTVVTNNLNIDWTAPSDITPVNDGNSIDIDTSFNNNQLIGNWSVSSDSNSGIEKYIYSFGIAPNDSSISILNINNLLNTTATLNSLSLNYNTIYYLNVKATNAAGLNSAITSSDGILILEPNNIIENKLNKISIYPNPASSKIIITNNSFNQAINDIQIYNTQGAQIKTKFIKSENGINIIDVSDLPNGIYLIKLNYNSKIEYYKFTVLH